MRSPEVRSGSFVLKDEFVEKLSAEQFVELFSACESFVQECEQLSAEEEKLTAIPQTMSMLLARYVERFHEYNREKLA